MRTAAAKPRITQVGKSEPGVKEQMKPMTGQREVRSFVGKLREDMNDPLHGTPHSIQDVDRQINEWLEQYPQYDVTSVTSAVGELRSKKGNEHVLILTVWFQRRADQ